MRSNIIRRLRQLEQKAHIHDPPQPVICVTFVSPEGPCQSRRAECGDQVWERERGENRRGFPKPRARESTAGHTPPHYRDLPTPNQLADDTKRRWRAFRVGRGCPYFGGITGTELISRARKTLCPTSETGAAMLSPGAFAFYFGGGRDILVCLMR